MNRQCQRIMDYINEHGSISQLEATRELGITRLSGRIYDLKHLGVSIERYWETELNRYGEKTRYCRYTIR